MQFASAVVFLLLGPGTLDARPVQVVSDQAVQSAASTKDGATWWISTRPVDPLEASRPPEKAASDEPGEDWKPAPVPADLGDYRTAEKQEIYYRKAFVVPEDTKQALSLRLGEISDRDIVYLNGSRLTSTGQWDSPFPQAYDRVRLYELPDDLLIKGGVNVVIVHVQGFFPWEIGIYRDRVEIGPALQIERSFFLENTYQLFSLIIYATAGGYFLFLFIRQRHDRENLYFAMFILVFTLYSLLRTQYKFILDPGISFFWLKRIQYTALFLTFPTFYFFIRHYFSLPEARWVRIWDRVFQASLVLPLGTSAAIMLLDNAVQWENINRMIAQPGWLIHIIGSGFLIGRAALKKDTDALAMAGGFAVMLVTVLLDLAVSQNILNLPTLTTYSFILYILGIALILANRFVRVSEQNLALNVELTGTNKAMTKFVPQEFLGILGRSRIVDVNIGDQTQREMTILFSDIRSFTTLSEGMSPKENFDFINSYLRRVGPIIREHGGFIDKYIGDAIMALFPNSPEQALDAAISMHKRVQGYNARRLEVGFKPIGIGIGLHTGMLMLGTIGEAERMDGTVISDNVNLASRIEGLTKQYGSTILVSEALYNKLPDKTKYTVRFVDRVIVKGKSSSVSVIEILDSEPPETAALKIQTRALFEQAVALYGGQNFPQAAQVLEKVLSVNPADGAAKLYLERSRYYAAHGVPLDWEGVEEMKSK